MRPKGAAAHTKDVKDVIKEMQNSPTAAYLRECTLHERIMLASLIKCVKREGTEEIKVGDVSPVQYYLILSCTDLNNSCDINT